ncbi:MAG: type II toxin-antitoxin system Phd/YefM family antitoxin [Chloroflexi bacterium]|nr:type II toxin-antitoxin system Phd/YefM family antitoxin [Chloroflexota bacterium]
MEKSIGAYEARRKLGQLIEEAFYRHDRFIIERSGRAMAVIVPIDEYHRWKQLTKDGLFGMLEETWQRNEGVPPESLDKDVEKAMATLRRERASRKAS